MRLIAPNTLLHQRYRTLRLVGSGAMGAVYEAEDQRLGHRVALKHNDPASTLPADAFQREARLLAHLRHPALPSVSDYFSEAEDQFLVMPFIPGADLGEVLRQRDEPFPLADVLRWADQLLDALTYLHQQRPPVIHRDIKPQNLKLGARGEIILLDFGVAKGAPPLDARPETGGSIHAFTRQYAPLEQIQGSGTDARSDLYALAATLYHLLTARPPADALTRALAAISQQPDPLADPRSINPAIPSPVAETLMAALALNQAQRPASAVQLRAALRVAAERALRDPGAEVAYVAAPREAERQASLDAAVAPGAAGPAARAAAGPAVQPALPDRPADRSPGANGRRGAGHAARSLDDGPTERGTAPAGSVDARPPAALFAPLPQPSTRRDAGALLPARWRWRIGIAALVLAILALLVSLNALGPQQLFSIGGPTPTLTPMVMASPRADPPTLSPMVVAGTATMRRDVAQASATTSSVEQATAEPVQATSVPATQTPMRIIDDGASAPEGSTVVKWFVGLGTGTDLNNVEREQGIVEEYNATNEDQIYIALNIIPNAEAYNVLATQIAAGTPPDIVGPVGMRGLSFVGDNLLALDELIKANNVDLGAYDEGALNAYQTAEGKQLTLPYALFPSLIYFNKDLFDAAGLPYPPQKVGEQYDGKEWNMETLKELAMKLTLDENGVSADEQGFDPARIVQFGFVPQWQSNALNTGAFFGAGDLTGPNDEATIPEAWQASWRWFYDGRHVSHFIPDSAYENADEFGRGNVWSTGKVAMAWTHLWYTCCFTGDQVPSWDLAVVPSYNGTTTAKLHADTFAMVDRPGRTPEETDAAFKVYMFLLRNEELRRLYGGLPPITADQPAYFEALSETFAPAEINWDVALEMLKYPDIPNHEQNTPNYLKFQDRLAAFDALANANPNLDLDAEIKRLETDLTAIFQGQ